MAVKNLLSVEEAATVIGCTDGRVRQLLRSGELKGVKLNERAWAVFAEAAERLAKTPATVGRPRVGLN